MPLVWAMRSMGTPHQERLYGPDVMTTMLQEGITRGWRHYFYGSTQETLDKLQAAIRYRYPKVEIVGVMSPPFRPLTATEDESISAESISARPDLIWVGLG